MEFNLKKTTTKDKAEVEKAKIEVPTLKKVEKAATPRASPAPEEKKMPQLKPVPKQEVKMFELT